MHKANPDTSWFHGGVIHGWTLNNISCSLKLIVYKARSEKASIFQRPLLLSCRHVPISQTFPCVSKNRLSYHPTFNLRLPAGLLDAYLTPCLKPIGDSPA